MTKVRVCSRALAVLAGVTVGGVASGQENIGPSLGTVEFRWRERSTPGYNGSYTIGPWVTPGVDAVPTPSPSAASVTAQDASVVLVLEAKVTQAAGLTGNPIRGLRAASFDILTNQTSGGAFARSVVTNDANGTLNPRANGRVTTTNLGFNPATLHGHVTGSRGTIAPFTALSETAGPGVGVVDGNPNLIRKPLFGLITSVFGPTSPDEPPPPGIEVAAMNAWAPLYLAVYTITDVSTPRDIVFTLQNTGVGGVGGVGDRSTDFQLRTWRGQGNPQNFSMDLWQLSPGFTTPPTFTVHVVPNPGAVGMLGLAALIVGLRRRRPGAAD